MGQSSPGAGGGTYAGIDAGIDAIDWAICGTVWAAYAATMKRFTILGRSHF